MQPSLFQAQPPQQAYYQPRFAAAIRDLPESLVALIANKARALKSSHRDVIDCSIGESNFPRPKYIRDAMANTDKQDTPVYTPLAGSMRLLNVIQDKVKYDYGLEYGVDEICGFNCGKSAIDCVIRAFVGPGDRVVLQTPHWVSYIPQVSMAGGNCYLVETSAETRFKMTSDQLAAALTPETKLLILCPLNNPTGTLYTPEEMAALADVIRQFPQLTVLSDDIYQHTQFDQAQKFSNIVSVCPELKERTCIIGGTTKTHSLRFGYLLAPRTLMPTIKRVQTHREGHVDASRESGAVIALANGLDPARVTLNKERHDFIMPRLNAIPGLSCLPSDGAFYAFVDIRDCLHAAGIASDTAFCLDLLDQEHVAVVPGTAFGMPGFMRINYSRSTQDLEQVCERLQRFVLAKRPAPVGGEVTP